MAAVLSLRGWTPNEESSNHVSVGLPREMRMVVRVLSMLTFVAAFLATTLPSAAQYSEVVKRSCRNDYKRSCSTYALDDPGLRKCMDKAGPSLSRNCVIALVNSGEVSYQRATTRWGHKLKKAR